MRGHRVLIIGVGSIGERHARTFGQTGRCQVAICETNQPLRETIAQRYGLERSYGDVEAAIREGVDAAVICTPAQLHIPIAHRLAEAGVHMLIEKPLSTSLEGVDRLRTLVQNKGLTAAVAYVWRCHPLLADMRQVVASGRFGQPVQINIVTGQHFPTFRPAYRQIYYTSHATGGGAIQDALTHMVNAAEWFVGPVDRLVVDADHLILEGVSVEDSVHAITRHGPVMGSISLNQHQAPTEIILTVHCRNGTARLEGHENRWRWMVQKNGPWTDVSFPPVERDTPFLRQANAFLDALERKAAPPCSLEEGLQTLRVNLAALASAREGVWKRIESKGF